jgi:hypothetical protein
VVSPVLAEVLVFLVALALMKFLPAGIVHARRRT